MSVSRSVSTVVRNVVAIALTWVLGFVLIRVFLRAGIVGTAGPFVAALIGVGAAVAMRARVAAVVLSTALAIGSAELFLAIYYGPGTGGAGHRWAIGCAALVAITLGWTLGSRKQATVEPS